MIYSYFHNGIIKLLIQGDIEKVINFISSFEIFAEIILILLVVLEVVLAPIPPLVLYIVAGILFGGFLGGILVLVGNLIGSFIDFKIARNFGNKYIRKKMNEKLKKKFDKFFDKYGGLSIFILRINPLTTSDLVSYLSGLTKIKALKFMIATTLGLIPLIFIQTYFGDFFISNNPILLGITILFSVVYLAIFFYLLIISLHSKKN